MGFVHQTSLALKDNAHSCSEEEAQSLQIEYYFWFTEESKWFNQYLGKLCKLDINYEGVALSDLLCLKTLRASSLPGLKNTIICFH